MGGRQHVEKKNLVKKSYSRSRLRWARLLQNLSHKVSLAFSDFHRCIGTYRLMKREI